MPPASVTSRVAVPSLSPSGPPGACGPFPDKGKLCRDVAGARHHREVQGEGPAPPGRPRASSTADAAARGNQMMAAERISGKEDEFAYAD